MKLANISSDLELKIRREFSSKLKNLIALKRWIDDTIGQMVLHDSQNLYRYKTRVKEIQSVLAKIDGKIQNERDKVSKGDVKEEDAKWSNADSFDDFEFLLDDWVGCRIITYLHDVLPVLHRQILSHKRMNVLHVTIHDSAVNPQFSSIKLKKGRDEKRINHNGYVGLHYIIEPKTVDPCWVNDPLIFRKFELQVRTLLQETWGEIQHEVIYKGRMPDSIKQERSDSFASLANLLAHCDSELARLAQDPNVRALAAQKSRPHRKIRQKSLRFT